MTETDILKGETEVLRTNWRAAEQRAAEWRELAQELLGILSHDPRCQATMGGFCNCRHAVIIEKASKMGLEVPHDRT